MQISTDGMQFLENEEGYRTTVYRDSRGLPTVGVGHLVTPSDNLKVGDTITNDQVTAFLQQDLQATEDCITNNVASPLTQNQFDALTSLIYNIGCRAFIHSTVLSLLNRENYSGAANAFLMWKNAGGRPILLARRERERTLFLTEDATDNQDS